MVKILVVDDEPTDRMLIATILGTNPDYEVFEADGGENGLHLALKEFPDLIITDIKMPSMNGYQLANEVRSHPSIAHTQVVFYSGVFADRSQALRAIAHSGVQRIILKATEPLEVLEQVNSALQSEKLRFKSICPNFIVDLGIQIKKGEGFLAQERIWSSLTFKTWREATNSLIVSMNEAGCNLGNGCLTRYYRLMPLSGTPAKESACFDADLKATLDDLKAGKLYFENKLMA